MGMVGMAVAALVAMLALAPALAATELTDNLVADGGMEEWQATGPQGGPFGWDYLTVQWKAAEFARDEQGRILTPKITDQFYDTHVVKPETEDVHGGRKALRLKGQLYLRQSSQDAYRTRDGDIYLVRYWVKGEGQSLMHFTIYGDAAVQMLEVKGKPEKDRWSLIEERLQVVGRAPTTVFPRLWASQELLIDDVSVVRILRPDERKLEAVAADLQKRVAFAWPADGAVTLDGKLDEPGWSRAVAFSGFRSHEDQSLLAPVQPSFRVLFDKDNLYFGLEIPLPGAPQALADLKSQPLLDAQGKPRPATDTFTGRHSVELFPQAPGQSGYRQLAVSLDGYRYDGSGMDKEWNGAWEFGVSAGEDRWYLEMKVPVRDLGIEQVAPAEGWRLNLCNNQPDGASTWSAVGGNFHNPDAFGELVAQDFGSWQAAQPGQWQQQKAAILQAAGARAAQYAERLTVIEAAAGKLDGSGAKADERPDWQAVTRAATRADYLGSAYRRVSEEVRYAGFFQSR
jgi:hypothetical protein